MAIQNNFPNIRPALNLDFANVKSLDPRITFTRASTATYYDGKTFAKAEENLLVRSQEFEAAEWVKANVSVTANTTVAPDGTTTAETLTASAGASQHYLQCSSVNLRSVVAGVTYAFSTHIKQGTNRYAQLTAGNSTEFGLNVFLNIDLSTGTVGTVGSAVVSHSVKTLDSGWYRVELVATAIATGSSGNLITALVTSNTAARIESWTAAGTETIFTWGAQLEQRSSVTAYTPTTTAPITNYIPQLMTAPSGVARFDHNPVTGESLGLLIEEARTNRCLYSEDFSHGAWVPTNITVTANSVAAPDGNTTADTLTATAANGTLIQNLGVVASAAKTGSLYIKRKTGTGNIDLTMDGGSTWTTKTVTLAWTRIDITQTLADEDFGIRIATSGDEVYVWGGTVETGSFSTSYIKTEGAQATRNADAASMTGANFSSWYRADEGVVSLEMAWPYVGAYADAAGIAISDGTAQNYLLLARSGTGATPQFMGHRSGATQFNPYAGTISANANFKTAFAYKINDAALALNGTQTAFSTDTSGLVPPGLNVLYFGNYVNAVTAKWIKRLAYYPARLTNANLQALTA